MRIKITIGIVAAVLFAAFTANGQDFPAPKSLGDSATYGRNVQRTMRLLAESTPENPNTVRVLFYGQSITEQGWWKLVADDLRQRFPSANLIIENRALGGYASQLLVRTAETDLYPFQPDLLIFHVYGAHDKYEDIIRRTRERTCAEILMQTDHVTKPSDLTEETDPAKVPIQSGNWDAFMNHNWLPSVAKKYGAELCDQRAIWKQYLTDYELQPQALLKDGVHLNAHGEYLMAECVKAYLRRDPKFDPAPLDACLKTFVIGKDIRWENGKLRLEFEGNRVDVVCRPIETDKFEPATVTIDGKKPSEISELYGFTPALSQPGSKWPPIAPISSEKPLVAEVWTLEVDKDPANEKLFTFKLSGSKTGDDGEGRSDKRFVSKSGRVVIAPEDWNVEFALSVLAGIKPVPEHFTVRWSAVCRAVDTLSFTNATNEKTITLAQGLVNSKHTLEITGSADSPIQALRVYCPPLKTTYSQRE